MQIKIVPTTTENIGGWASKSLLWTLDLQCLYNLVCGLVEGMFFFFVYCKTNRPITFKSLLTRNLKLVYMPKCSSRHVTGKYPDSLQFSDVHRVISRDSFFPLCVTGGIALRLTLSSSQGCKAFYSLLTGRAESIQQRNKSLLQVGLKLVSQARSTSAKKGLVNCTCV